MTAWAENISNTCNLFYNMLVIENHVDFVMNQLNLDDPHNYPPEGSADYELRKINVRNVQQEMAKEMRYQNMATKAIESMPPSEMLFSDHEFKSSQPLRDSVNTFHLWVKAINTGSILWSCACTLAYAYMVAAWGGYTFIINLV